MGSWLKKVGVETLFIEPGSPWENGYCEIFKGKPRDKVLHRKIFYTLAKAWVLSDRWRHHDNPERPNSSLGYRAPAPGNTVARALLRSAPQGFVAGAELA